LIAAGIWHQPTPAIPAARSASELREAAVDGDLAAVMKLLSGVTRKAATAAISAGSAMRWSGVIEAKTFWPSSPNASFARSSPAHGAPAMSAYSASKAAVRNLARTGGGC